MNVQFTERSLSAQPGFQILSLFRPPSVSLFHPNAITPCPYVFSSPRAWFKLFPLSGLPPLPCSFLFIKAFLLFPPAQFRSHPWPKSLLRFPHCNESFPLPRSFSTWCPSSSFFRVFLTSDLGIYVSTRNVECRNLLITAVLPRTQPGALPWVLSPPLFSWLNLKVRRDFREATHSPLKKVLNSCLMTVWQRELSRWRGTEETLNSPLFKIWYFIVILCIFLLCWPTVQSHQITLTPHHFSHVPFIISVTPLTHFLIFFHQKLFYKHSLISFSNPPDSLPGVFYV